MTTAGRMPTAAERDGDFSRTRSALGQLVQIVDPVTGVPFGWAPDPPGSDQSAGQGPAGSDSRSPNFEENARYNYQVPVLSTVHGDSIRGSLTRSVRQKNTTRHQRRCSEPAPGQFEHFQFCGCLAHVRSQCIGSMDHKILAAVRSRYPVPVRPTIDAAHSLFCKSHQCLGHCGDRR